MLASHVEAVPWAITSRIESQLSSWWDWGSEPSWVFCLRRNPAKRRANFCRKKAEEGKEYAQRKARELRERADDLVERGKQVAARQKDIISAAVDAGREAYQREKSKAQ